MLELFWQRRYTKYGYIPIAKFQSMVKDANKPLPELLNNIFIKDGRIKIEDDPRITRGGRLTRKFFIDELPQMVNVVRGDISLLG